MKKLFSNSIIIRIIISIVLFVISFFIDNDIICTFLLIISYIILTYEMFINALENILSKQFFDENTLMIIATTGAFLINEYHEAIMVILLFKIGEYLSDRAVDNSKRETLSLMNLKTDLIHLLVDGK